MSIFSCSRNRRGITTDCNATREPLGKDQREAGLIRARKYGYSGKGTYQDWYHKQRQGSDRLNKKATGHHLMSGQAKKLSAPELPSLPHPIRRNKRSVWTVAPRAYHGAHFATFPPDLIEPCILAGAPKGGIVLDPFGGSGTTGVVAKKLGRQYILIDSNKDYVKLARQRIEGILPPQPVLIAAE